MLWGFGGPMAQVGEWESGREWNYVELTASHGCNAQRVPTRTTAQEDPAVLKPELLSAMEAPFPLLSVCSPCALRVLSASHAGLRFHAGLRVLDEVLGMLHKCRRRSMSYGRLNFRLLRVLKNFARP